MWSSSIRLSTAQARKWREVDSGPLSQRMRFGQPYWFMAFSRTRVTRRVAKLVSASRATHCRLNASTTLSTRIARPVASASDASQWPIPHSPAYTGSSCWTTRARRLRFRRFTINPAPSDRTTCPSIPYVMPRGKQGGFFAWNESPRPIDSLWSSYACAG